MNWIDRLIYRFSWGYTRRIYEYYERQKDRDNLIMKPSAEVSKVNAILDETNTIIEAVI